MPVTERAHLSIGEVLALLHDEFPDITISKIRFLESQGLLEPERTPSGYRKFYEPDIERLRWILRQQKDNFLPLKVIKDRLAGKTTAEAPPAAEPEPRPEPRSAPSVAAVEPEPVTVASPEPAAAAPDNLDMGVSAVSLTRDELSAATGLHDKVLAELERYGLICGRPMGRDTIYDEESLVVARLAASFLRFGVEARHLRMYKVSAEREASFFEQVVLPLVKQRNPDARRQAVVNLSELTALGESLRSSMLRQALKGYTGGI